MSDNAQGVESQIKELKVSGHTMMLEPGLYCVYNAPGGPVANEAGLPGVRITAAPQGGRGRISISTFASDGWIGADSAALVRVTQGRADLLVTVYQSKDSKSEAPKLQVVRLANETAAAAPVAAPAPLPTPVAPPAIPAAAKAAKPQATGKVEVVAHIYGAGDLTASLGEWIGEPGSQRWVEGFGIAPPEGIDVTDIEYQAVLGRGWLSPWSHGGQFCGSRGMSLPILGLRVRLRGEAAKAYQVALAATFVDGTRTGPVGDGEPCEAPSLAALEAFQIALTPVGSAVAKAPASGKGKVPGKVKTKEKAGKQAAPVLPTPAVVTAPVVPTPAPVVTAAPAARGKPGPKPKATAAMAEPVATPAAKPAKGKGKPETVKADVVKAGVVKADVAKEGKAKAGKVKPGKAKPVETKVAEAKPVVAPKAVSKPARAAKRTPATTRRR